ncbi:hypothetical protein Pst134EA_032009 [Puccinia striiformis f. sp. tritici]|uniref:uncharacterized protein n=1 Tax=Puccinia striiformis f. sp. tritici TaxID=168172 RepID=UPI002008B450|nr:uncharacterized protein Pst134EA_032009 [Puccinia striiformis f. sp. tritici]KAH9441966.1 hypothetical protein Pst134EA_032009 [Puccinia striiformis f. sp. tritici]
MNPIDLHQVHTDSIGPTSTLPTRSHYHLSREEWIKGIANRFVFSQVYLYLYLSMAILSVSYDSNPIDLIRMSEFIILHIRDNHQPNDDNRSLNPITSLWKSKSCIIHPSTKKPGEKKH